MNRKNITLALFSALLLTSCSGNDVRKSFGLSRSAPDEFLVISRPPLSVPPDFSLKPPSSLKELESDKSRDAAKNVLFPEKQNASNDKVSRGEFILLKNAKAEEGNPEIRKIMAKEQMATETIEEEKGVLDSIVDTFTPGTDDPVVDVNKEEERIANNIKDGKPVNEGEIPTNQDAGSQGLINQMLGN